MLGNTNGVRGGAIFIERTTLFIERTEFHDSWIGPNLYSEGGTGGCLFAKDSVLKMADTIVSNSASRDGGAIACIGGELQLTRASTMLFQRRSREVAEDLEAIKKIRATAT